MDVFKLTFETVIIGLFALPWLWVVFDLAQPNLLTSASISRLLAPVPKEVRPHAIGLAFFPLAYLLGLMITPVASEFLNDPDMLGGVLPSDETIQALTYVKVGGPPIPGVDMPPKFQPANFPAPGRSDDAETPLDQRRQAENRQQFDKEFSREESTLLLRGPDSSGRVNRLHERLSVLQGATFSTFALAVLCCFAWCARSPKELNAMNGRSLRPQVRRSLGFLLSLFLIALAARSLIRGVHQPKAGDMPVAELVFLGLGIFGLWVGIYGTRSRLHFHGVGFTFALFFAVLCYGGYTSTEKSYAQEIFNNYQALQPANAAGSSQPVAPAMLASAKGQ